MKAKRIHYNSIVVDAHNDTMLKVIDDRTWLPKLDIGRPSNLHIDIPKLKEGGLDVAFFSSFTPGFYGDDTKSLSRTLAMINALHYTGQNNPITFQICTSVDEIYEAVNDNRIAAVATIEGAYGINEDNYLELLRQFYDIGIRVIAPTWNYSNHMGEGTSRCYGDKEKTPSEGGLTELGEKLVEEMNKLGILIDLSHMAESTFWDVIEKTKAPVLVSHSGVDRLKNHPRNLKDEQLLALKVNGGVVGVPLYPDFLSDKKEVYVKDYVDHIDYLVDLIGVDHVGLGSDFDGARMPIDLKDASYFYRITEELVYRNYADEDIRKILGENILRVLGQAQDRASYEIKKLKASIKYKEDIITLSIKDNGDINLANSRLIIDGIVQEPMVDIKNLSLYYELDRELDEKFHILTLEIGKGKVKERFTKILIS